MNFQNFIVIAYFCCLIFVIAYLSALERLASGPPPAAHARPSGLKRHSRREEAFKEGNFSKMFFSIFRNFKILYFLVIPGSWGVHRYPWFQNRSINMAKADPDKKSQMNCALLYRSLLPQYLFTKGINTLWLRKTSQDSGKILESFFVPILGLI